MKPILSLFIGSMLIAPAGVWGQTAEADKAPVPTQAVAADGTASVPQTAAAPENTATATTPDTAKEPVAATQETKAPASQPASAAPESAQATPEQKALENNLAQAGTGETQPPEDFVAARETVEEVEPEEEQVVVYSPKSQRDPMLSPDDFLLIQHREQQRLAAIEAERQRKLEEERRKQEEAERLRRLELERIKDPTREVRNKIRIGGVIGQEVFIGSKIYTVGNTIYGARIVAVKPDEVVFSYKGHRFVRKVQL